MEKLHTAVRACAYMRITARVQSVCANYLHPHISVVFSKHIFNRCFKGVLQGLVLGPLIFFKCVGLGIRPILREILAKLNAKAHLQDAVRALVIHRWVQRPNTQCQSYKAILISLLKWNIAWEGMWSVCTTSLWPWVYKYSQKTQFLSDPRTAQGVTGA